MSELREVIYRLTLDLVRETDACIYGLKVGETGSRVLKITLLENGSAYNIDSGITPRLRIKKPDNTIVYADCTVENNIITFDLSAHQQIYAAAGVAEAALELCSNEKAFVSCPFKIIIENQVVSNEEIESSDDFAALKKMEGKINEAYNTSIQAQNNLDKLENKVASVEQIPRNIKVWLDTTSYDKPTVMISCDVLDKFLDPTVAENTYYRYGIEVSADTIGEHTVYLNSNFSADYLWALSEDKYPDSIAVCKYWIGYSSGAGKPYLTITDFVVYNNEDLLERYIKPMQIKIDDKEDMFYLKEDSLISEETDEEGNRYLDVKYSSGLVRDAYNQLSVDTDVIAERSYVESLLSGAVQRKVVASLPTENIDGNTIYMIPAETAAENNIYNEFMYINGAWEQIGSTAVDLSGYVTTDDLANAQYPTNISVTIDESADEIVTDFTLGADKYQDNVTIPPFESIPVWEENETEKDFYMSFHKESGGWSVGIAPEKDDYTFCILHVVKTDSGSEITGYELIADSYIFNKLSGYQKKLHGVGGIEIIEEQDIDGNGTIRDVIWLDENTRYKLDYFVELVYKVDDLEAGKQDKHSVAEALPATAVANSEYYLGDVSTDTTLSFPSSASQGDTIYVDFNCSAEFTLTIDTTYTSDIDIDIEVGVGYEIFATWNGSMWILGYNEYTVS